MIGDAGEDVAEIALRIKRVHLCGLDERVDRGGALSAGVRAGEEIVLAAECERANGALRRVVVDGNATVVCVLFSAGLMTALTLLALRVDLARSYDAGLAVKVALAVALLALAAINKFTLTPWIRARRRSIRYLRYAIQVELVLALGVICATAILTTYASPH